MIRTRGPATTLVELLVVMGLLGIVVTMVYFVVHAGLKFYLDSTAALEIRQEALVGLNRMSLEMRESSLASVAIDMTSPTKGIVFASIRNAAGLTSPTSDGKLTWQRLSCYYVVPYQDSQAIFRKEEPLPGLVGRAPDPLGLAPPRDPTYFLGLGTEPRVIARQVLALNITKTVDSLDISLSCQVSTRHTHMVELRTKIVPNLL